MQNKKSARAAQFDGWSNLATDMVYENLFAYSGAEDYLSDIADYDHRRSLLDTLENILEEYAYAQVEAESHGSALEYASMFLENVNFGEIAEHMYNQYMADMDEAMQETRRCNCCMAVK